MAVEASGVLELEQKQGGFLRSPEARYRVRSEDPFVRADVCKANKLRGGELIVGTARSAKRNGKKKAQRGSRLELDRIESINGRSVDDHLVAPSFEDLVPIDPDHPVRFETPECPESMRVVDLLTPIGFGQRGLIAAPPRTGKTILLKQMADGLATNHPEANLIMLLVDERPEEVTEMRRFVRGEVIASSNDQDAKAHVRLSRLVIARAKRQVEAGEHVVMFLDSLTRVGRAFNAILRGQGRTMSGGIDAGALNEPKSIFGAARIEGGGSLTIIATALIETGSRMDEVIFNEFKGTGNMEIMLSREMANMRMYPAIDLEASGTRKEDKLLTPAELAAVTRIRRSLHGQGGIRTMEQLLMSMRRFPNNPQFVAALNAS